MDTFEIKNQHDLKEKENNEYWDQVIDEQKADEKQSLTDKVKLQFEALKNGNPF